MDAAERDAVSASPVALFDEIPGLQEFLAREPSIDALASPVSKAAEATLMYADVAWDTALRWLRACDV